MYANILWEDFVMALIICPECGKENVSDTAEACPNCGYGIKVHFYTVKMQQLKQEIHEKRLQNVKMPEEPKK